MSSPAAAARRCLLVMQSKQKEGSQHLKSCHAKTCSCRRSWFTMQSIQKECSQQPYRCVMQKPAAAARDLGSQCKTYRRRVHNTRVMSCKNLQLQEILVHNAKHTEGGFTTPRVISCINIKQTERGFTTPRVMSRKDLQLAHNVKHTEGGFTTP